MLDTTLILSNTDRFKRREMRPTLRAIPLLQTRPRNLLVRGNKNSPRVCRMPDRLSKLACDITATAKINASPCGQEEMRFRSPCIPRNHRRGQEICALPEETRNFRARGYR